MDSRCAPQRICDRHPSNQFPYLGIELRPPFSPRFASPVATKPLFVPVNDGLWLNDEQGVAPLWPYPGYKHQITPIQTNQLEKGNSPNPCETYIS